MTEGLSNDRRSEWSKINPSVPFFIELLNPFNNLSLEIAAIALSTIIDFVGEIRVIRLVAYNLIYYK